MNDYRFIADLQGPPGSPGIPNRGIIDEPTDMDGLRTIDDVGAYAARMENLINGPDDPTGQVVTVEVLYSATNGVTQRVNTSTRIHWRTAQSNEAFNSWWSTAREDEIVRITHGVLGSTTDIDAYRTEADVGAYVIRANNIIGGPPLSGDNPLVTFEVIWGISNGVVQRITSRNEMWWRAAASSTEWADWNQVLTSGGSSSGAVISTDRYPAEDLAEGQILYIIDPAHRAYDFGSWPESMSRAPDGVGGIWIRNNNQGLLGGRGIIQNGGSVSTILWGEADGFRDGDILTRMSRSVFGSTANSALVARVTDDGATTSAYTAYVALFSGEPRLAISRRDDGSNTVLQSQAVDLAEDDVFYIRFNLDGSMLRARAWLANDREPDSWLLSTQDSTYQTGGVGFQSGTTGTAWDVLSINESGGLAA